jgi:N-acetylmuramoyl-L-alanine amidase
VAPDGGNRAIIAPSDRLARALRAAFRSATGEHYADYVAQQGLTRRSDLGGLNLARVPAVFIETGNMRNSGDASRLTSRSFRQSAAVGIDRAVIAFLAE